MRLVLLLILMAPVSFVSAQQGNAPAPGKEVGQTAKPAAADPPSLPDAPSAQPAAAGETAATTAGVKAAGPVKPKPQPQRILGVMPNFRAVSAGEMPPPPTAKEAFKLATQNSFDYSSFLFVGITSAIAEGTDTHSQLGKGMAGFGRYYWRGFVDKTDGNYLVIFALPQIFHQDERYFALGQGGFWKRMGYSVSRVLVTPNYQGHPSFNVSELLGRGIAQGISISYYPSQSRTAGQLAQKYAFAIGRDALTNAFREFWPDIAAHLRHHPASAGSAP